MKILSTCLVLLMAFSHFPTHAYAEVLFPEVPDFSQVKMSDVPSHVNYLEWPTDEIRASRSEEIYLLRGASQVLKFDRPVSRVSISNPEVMDIVAVGPDEIIVTATDLGMNTLIVWDEDGLTASYYVHCINDIDRFRQVVKKISPKGNIQVIPYESNLAVVGTVGTLGQKEAIENAAISLLGEQVYNGVKVEDAKQVLLEVRFAEVDRVASRNFGIDFAGNKGWWIFDSLIGNNITATDDSGTGVTVTESRNAMFPPTASPASGGANLSAWYLSRSVDIRGFLEMLEQKSVLKIIARPNLLAQDGEEAKFVVGGELPVIFSSGDNVNVEFKEFGTTLRFTPTIQDNGSIKLETNTLMSELDFANTVTVGGTSLPSIIKTEHETVAELRDGETLVVGGLLTQRISKTDSKVPILGDLPFISKLFRKEEFARKDIEILLVITPRIVRPYHSMDRRKDPFPESIVEEAVQTHYPAFPEEQGDLINMMLTQGEKSPVFEDEELNGPVEMAKAIGREALDMKRLASFVGLKKANKDLLKKVDKDKKRADYIDAIYEAELLDSGTQLYSAPYVSPANEEVLEEIFWEDGKSAMETSNITSEPVETPEDFNLGWEAEEERVPVSNTFVEETQISENSDELWEDMPSSPDRAVEMEPVDTQSYVTEEEVMPNDSGKRDHISDTLPLDF